MLNIIYLLFFLISSFLLVFYCVSLLKSQKIVSVKINIQQQNKKKILLLSIISFIIISVILNVIYAIIIAVVLGNFLWLKSLNKKQEYKRNIDKQILETIRLFRNSVSSGESIVQAIDSLSTQIKEPLSLEFKEISNKIKLGISLDEALKQSTKNIQNEQYKFFIDSIRISHSTGIKISDILLKIEQSITQKLSITTKVDVLTSQVRFSGIVISVIPFFIVFLIYFVEPEIVSVLFTTLIGNFILLVCVIMIISGSLIMKKIADIKL